MEELLGTCKVIDERSQDPRLTKLVPQLDPSKDFYSSTDTTVNVIKANRKLLFAADHRTERKLTETNPASLFPPPPAYDAPCPPGPDTHSPRKK